MIERQDVEALLRDFAMDLRETPISDGSPWRFILQEAQVQAIINRLRKHLCPPVKLEWECDVNAGRWYSKAYRVCVNESGWFDTYEKNTHNHGFTLRFTHSTLEDAKAAAQSHSEASHDRD